MSKQIFIFLLVLLFSFVKAAPALSAVFPVTYVKNESNIPTAIKSILPKVQNELGYKDHVPFILNGYQRIGRIPSIGSSGWWLIIRVDYSPSLGEYRYASDDNFSAVLVDDKGKLVPGNAQYMGLAIGSRLQFLFYINYNTLSLVTLNYEPSPREPNRGDSIDIHIVNTTDIKYKNGNGTSLFSRGTFDHRDINNQPSEQYLYDELYFADFDNTGTTQIMCHGYHFSMTGEAKRTKSDCWDYSKLILEDTNLQYKKIDISQHLMDRFKKRCTNDLGIVACELHPLFEDIREVGTKTLGANESR